MKRRAQGELPVKIQDGLKEFVLIMYFRFEFARGYHSTYYNPVDKSSIEDDGYGLCNFKNVLNRKQFMPAVGGTTYLEDLKADVKRAKKKNSEALAALRTFVCETCCPLTHHESVIWNRYQEGFFPSPPHLTGASELRNYCYALFELQDYLISAIGVRPGLMLPAWIVAEPSEETHGMPLIGLLPVRRSIRNTLVEYLMWEYGHDYESYTTLPGDRNNPNFLNNALRWGRVFSKRRVDELTIEDRSDIGSAEINFRKRSLIRNLIAKINCEAGVSEFPESLQKEIDLEIEKHGEHPGTQSPEEVRKMVEYAAKAGMIYFGGKYKELWFA